MREVNWRLREIGKRKNSNLSIQASLHGLSLKEEDEDEVGLTDEQQEAMDRDLAKIKGRKRQK